MQRCKHKPVVALLSLNSVKRSRYRRPNTLCIPITTNCVMNDPRTTNQLRPPSRVPCIWRLRFWVMLLFSAWRIDKLILQLIIWKSSGRNYQRCIAYQISSNYLIICLTSYCRWLENILSGTVLGTNCFHILLFWFVVVVVVFLCKLEHVLSLYESWRSYSLSQIEIKDKKRYEETFQWRLLWGHKYR